MRISGKAACFSPIIILAACGTAAPVGDDLTVGASGVDETMSSAMELRLTDTPNDQLKEVVVSLKRIDVKVEDVGWFSIMNKMQTLDLLDYQRGAFQVLSASQLPAGHVTEFRIYTEDTAPNYVTTPDGQHHELKMPTGVDCGIKIKADFRISGCAKGYVTFDYDARQSISSTFTSSTSYGGTQSRLTEQWVLTPIVRLRAVVAVGTCADLVPPTTVVSCGDAGVAPPPSTTPPSVTTPPVTPPPSVTTPPSTTMPPPVSTTTPPGSTPPVIVAPPPPSDPCEKISCAGATCVNGVCSPIIN